MRNEYQLQIFGSDMMTSQNNYKTYKNYRIIVLRCYNVTTEYLIFFSHFVTFLSPGIDYRAAVFEACKICAFDQSNVFVLIAKYKIFFYYLANIFYFILYSAIKTNAFDLLNTHILHT